MGTGEGVVVGNEVRVGVVVLVGEDVREGDGEGDAEGEGEARAGEGVRVMADIFVVLVKCVGIEQAAKSASVIKTISRLIRENISIGTVPPLF